MRYHQQLTVERQVGDDLEQLCSKGASDAKKDGVEFDQEVVFENGYRMAVQVCTSDPNEPAWTQGVLFDASGVELDFTEPGEVFAQSYAIEYDGDEYVCEVLIA